MQTLKILFFMATLSQAMPGRAAEILTYMLLPGSTITPYTAGFPSGPAQPLSGTFQWVQIEDEPSFSAFNAVALNFSSASFTLTLNQTPANMHGTSVFPGSTVTYFSEVANLTGLTISTAQMNPFVAGSYTGDPDRPSFLNCPNIHLIPLGGGSSAGRVDFQALLVPEPATWTLISLGFLMLLGIAKRRRLF